MNELTKLAQQFSEMVKSADESYSDIEVLEALISNLKIVRHQINGALNKVEGHESSMTSASMNVSHAIVELETVKSKLLT
jgi:NifU-like protein involved in Fe-S cluster formation